MVLNLDHILSEKCIRETRQLTDFFRLEKYKNLDKYLVLNRFTKIDEDSMTHYMRQHEKLMKKTHDKKMIIGYDFSTFDHVDMTYLETVAKMHKDFCDVYEKSVECVFVCVKSKVLVSIGQLVLDAQGVTVPVILTHDEEVIYNALRKYLCLNCANHISK